VDVDSFIRDGFVAVRQAVDASTAAACRELIWQSMAERGLHRSDPASWPPLVRIDDLDAGPFTAAGLSPTLAAAYDELIGPGRWSSPVGVGRAVMVRFPSQDRAGAGYHVEASYPGPGGRGWRANVRSRARGLLALFLLTDVGPDDAPTRLVCGSHLTVARFLAPYGEEGADTDEADLWHPSSLSRPVAHATGKAGDVFLCHPFIVHTATWPHRGIGPRMIAQPAVNAPAGFTLDGTDSSPIAQAITSALAMTE
jgi:Phytanoyl-CoA dioxygenase (PhyH)